jgi:hypothetical protein
VAFPYNGATPLEPSSHGFNCGVGVLMTIGGSLPS